MTVNSDNCLSDATQFVRSVSLVADTASFNRTVHVRALPGFGASLGGARRIDGDKGPSDEQVGHSSAHLMRTSTCAEAAMGRYANGDDAAFAEVYDALAPRVHAFLVRQTRDRMRADDLLQQTLLRIHRKRGSYLMGSPVLPWAIAIARRLFIDDMRRRKCDALTTARSVQDEDRLAAGAPDEELQSRETAWIVEAELSRMPETHRTAFELLRVDGLTHVEAAEVLGTTVMAVRLRAFRAYQAIRNAIRRFDDAECVKTERGP
ncbi:MAG TPA: RNA polymerase sigma factor [Polyangiaceae bacterium]